MPKLNQIIAIAAGKKTQTDAGLTAIYHKLQKTALLTGIARSYRPKDEDGDRLPSENKQVQYRVSDALKEAEAVLSEMFDVIATQEYANCTAFANIVVDDVVILHDVPVTFLLFLEKQLLNVHNLVEKIPTLDPGEAWTRSETANAWATPAAETVRTKKVLKNHVRAEATDKHPAQVDTYGEDVLVGYWSTVNFSGAIPESTKAEMLERVRKLQEAVKMAREQANSIDVTKQSVAEPVFDYLFDSL